MHLRLPILFVPLLLTAVLGCSNEPPPPPPPEPAEAALSSNQSKDLDEMGLRVVADRIKTSESNLAAAEKNLEKHRKALLEKKPNEADWTEADKAPLTEIAERINEINKHLARDRADHESLEKRLAGHMNEIKEKNPNK